MQRNRINAVVSLLAVASLVTACGSDEDTTTDEAPTTEPAPSDESAETPPLTPASITADAQESDGSSFTVASIVLPASGFVAIHADNGGSPGPIIGHSDVLPEGESTDVVIMFDEALTESQTVFPMAHVDVNDNGVYEFNGSDVTIDQPATTEAGDVAVVPAEVTVG